MWNFFKRQLTTKTGQFGTALVVSSIANTLFNDPEAANTALALANQALTPESGVFGLAAMFLRDRDAKKDQHVR